MPQSNYQLSNSSLDYGQIVKDSVWIERISLALEKNLFVLYAQPIASVKGDDSCQHLEILLRLQDRDFNTINPGSFLDIAKRNSLMPNIDTWVINNLFNQLEAQGKNKYWHNYRFSINLSGASLNCDRFLDFVIHKITHSHLSPKLFCWEITEEVAIKNLDKVKKFIETLKRLGCSFALDDFGKGMSSLTYLKNLPVDYLKIDGSFIRELNTDRISRIMVEAINHMAVGIGLKTIAEFVENRQILNTLQSLNIDYAQGYYLGRPQEFATIALTKLLSSRNEVL